MTRQRKAKAKSADAEPFEYVSADKPSPLRASKRNWQEPLQALRSKETYENLEEIERAAEATAKIADTRQRIPISEIVVAEKVFQWRGPYSNLQAEDVHMRELVRGLETGEDLQRVTVFRLGKKLYLVDGHHRLAAYVALKKQSIPVTHFKGNLHEAWLKSLAANVRDKLPITRTDKFDAALTLVKHKVRRGLEKPSCEEIAHHAVASVRLVYRMQALLKEALEAAKDKEDKDEVYGWSWKELQGKAKKEDDSDFDADEFRDREARKMAEAIMANVGRNLVANPDITARALHMISEELPRVLIEEWLDVVEGVLLEQAEATSEGVADAFTRAFKLFRSVQEAL